MSQPKVSVLPTLKKVSLFQFFFQVFWYPLVSNRSRHTYFPLHTFFKIQMEGE